MTSRTVALVAVESGLIKILSKSSNVFYVDTMGKRRQKFEEYGET